MTDHQRSIYRSEAERYQALVSREDHEGNILKAIEEIVRPDGLDVVDLGAGTGRLTMLLAARARTIRALDISEDMLRVCRQRLMLSRLSNWSVELADHRNLPFMDNSIDLIVSGWSVAYLAVWNPGNWRAELEEWFREAKRVLKRSSHIVLFESMGTGNESPVVMDHLKDYFKWLDEKGFSSKWIRTDYRFTSPEEAEDLSRFFFGDELADSVKKNRMKILPECTGVWWLKK